MTAQKPRARVRAAFDVTDSNGGRRINLVGRYAWALSSLIDSGLAGCTPIDRPGPRWSHYVFVLRRDYGLNIETITEAHGAPFPGTHARYVLRTDVRRADDASVREAA